MKKEKLDGATVSKVQNQKKSDHKKNGPSNKSPTGTKEWFDTNVPCVNGCSNECKYCQDKWQ